MHPIRLGVHVYTAGWLLVVLMSMHVVGGEGETDVAGVDSLLMKYG